ncbi:hypothetical protein KQ300_08645 [Synechococcus sp. CS-1331]|uniref:hypothetical protein n=1 Tax=Synechococcus sp. CS-1331 TaxID=2847973 RepID=UPI00223BDAC2|nr:hypothetical protein [Synechococcus sp. CS-1331]MCT0228249.1 hypothetical protein [Synechococcus sp. CS-1331]
MTTNTKAAAPADYVEIDLCLDLGFAVPIRNEDGTLGFRERNQIQFLQVFVPIGATQDSNTLHKYVWKQMESHNAEYTQLNGVYTQNSVDIWDEREEGQFSVASLAL